MVEGWPFTVAYRHTSNLQNVSFQSNERLNLVVTPAAFRSLGDLRSFLQLLNTVPDPHCGLGSKTIARTLTQNWLAPSRAKMSTLYRCIITYHACCVWALVAVLFCDGQSDHAIKSM